MSEMLKSVGKRFNSTYRTIEGKKVLGQLLDIPDTSRVSNFLSTRRYFRTNPKTNLVVGDVLEISNGVFYVVAEHGIGFYRKPIYIHFKMFEVTEILEHKRFVETVDPVTGVTTKSTLTSYGNLYLSTQPKTSIDDAIRIQHETKTCISNKPVLVDDIIGSWVVTKVDLVLGVTLIELKAL